MEANPIKPSKLELYLEILKTLNEHGQQKSSSLKHIAKIDPHIIHDQLDFLVKQGLVTSACLDKRVTCKITKRGSNVLKYFHSMQTRNHIPRLINEL
jgi:predicted transcriptional regulator